MIRSASVQMRRATDYTKNKPRLILEYILLAVVIVLLACLQFAYNTIQTQEMEICILKNEFSN